METKNKFIYGIVTLVASAMISVSCATTKENLTYFENLDSLQVAQGLGSNDYTIKVVPDDELKIVVTSQEPAATAHYNQPFANYASATELTASSTPALQTYVVDKKGNITMPVLGELNVAGKTTDEIAGQIRALVEKDVKDPYVTVKLNGFRVNVLGEVKEPAAMVVTKERYSIFDALADAGDLTEYGKRDNVLLIREDNGKKIYVRLNLNDAKLLESPYYYLQQNDVVYVEPNKIKKDNSKYNQNNGYKLSVISTIVSACSVVASLIIALATK